MRAHGLTWPDGADPLGIELKCIEMGGVPGVPLFTHYLNARKLLWPHRYENRWTRLIHQEITQNQVTILMGCASSGKTSCAVEWCLISYWARPANTLVLMTTTQLEKLETNVFGECKMLFEQGRMRHPWLSGNVLDHKHSIFTDSVEEDEVRDRRKGIVGKPCYENGKWKGDAIFVGIKQDYVIFLGDECFPAGTMVDTPSGRRKIETIVPGDIVFSAVGRSRVLACRRSFSKRLIKLGLNDGRSITLTPNHPVLTQFGWKKACEVCVDHYMVSTYEAMQIMRQKPDQNSTSSEKRMLQYVLLREMESEIRSNLLQEILHKGEIEKNQPVQNELVEEPWRFQGVDVSDAHGSQSDAQPGFVQESCYEDSGDGMQTPGSRRERNRSNQGRMAVNENVSRGYLELRRKDREMERERYSSGLQSRFGFPDIQARNRGGWRIPQKSFSESKGPEERFLLEGSWVDSVEIQEQGDLGFPATGADSRECRVFNLQVEGHPSYSVNGFLVHNCQYMAPSFIRSWAPLFANPHVKVIGSGNPNHDPDDPLGIAAEPIEGWNSMPEPDKTTCWATRSMGGRCVNLVGTDSPNFDGDPNKPDPYPKLIGRKFVERIEHDNGKNSPEYYRLVKGVMKISLADNRVINRELCRINKCHHPAQWANNERTRVHGLDPSYGGVDTCYEVVLEFGESLDGKILISFVYWGDIKLDAKRTDVKIEDQIAQAVQNTLQTHNIPARNSGYDSVGKGTVGFGFSHIFGQNGPEPVDSGQKPTNRPVRQGLYVTDEVTNIKRPKRCEEHYSKFITEMWFSTRLCKESGQVRNLPEEIMMDGVRRIYKSVAGNKIEVEPKDDLKERTGKSPNKYDAYAVAMEMARRRGFVIGTIGPDPTESKSEWKDDLSLDYHNTIREQLLDHAV